MTDPIERTLVLLKPESVERGICGEIITRFERMGLKIVGLKMVKPALETCKQHYPFTEEWALSAGKKALDNLKERGIVTDKTEIELAKEINDELINYFMKDPTPVIAIVLEGHMVIEIVRKMAGSTNPLKAAPGTIRGDFSQDSYVLSDYFKRPTANVIHASDSPETAKREINVWFKPEELISYSNLHDKLSYFWNTLQ